MAIIDLRKAEEESGGDFKEMPPGVYEFCVDEVIERKGENEMRTGEGLELRLLVAVPDVPFDVKVRDWIVYKTTPWKIPQILKATVGVSQDQIDTDELADLFYKKTGKARFDLGKPDNSGRRWLRVKEYIDASAPDEPEDDVPF